MRATDQETAMGVARGVNAATEASWSRVLVVLGEAGTIDEVVNVVLLFL